MRIDGRHLERIRAKLSSAKADLLIAERHFCETKAKAELAATKVRKLEDGLNRAIMFFRGDEVFDSSDWPLLSAAATED